MSARLAGRKISATRDYRLFHRSAENRVVNVKKHKALERSMKRYGFLSCFPIVCYRDGNKKLVVKDGQHRLAIAETLGLPVFWVEQDSDFDVAVVNSTAKVWVMRDYAEKFSASGIQDYEEGLRFLDTHKLPVGITFALLSGCTNFSNIEQPFKNGLFKIKDRSWADAVASLYGPLTAMSSDCRNARFLEACMAVCRVKTFDVDRLLGGAARCRDKLVSYSTRDAYLVMLEEIYNFGRKALIGLKADAMNAMKDRNPRHRQKQEAKEAEDVAA